MSIRMCTCVCVSVCACVHVQVHRGAYEAAQILYERFLPMVYEHLDSSPFAKICFTVRDAHTLRA